MAKPSEFYVGALDLFGILLPGAIATALLEPRVGHLILGTVISKPTTEAAQWVVFLAFSYFLGHLIFLVGSYLDPGYNILRNCLHPYDNESAFQCATAIRNSFLHESERQALNTFQWSRSVLLAKCPVAAQDVHRLEADSKFFRSLLVVSVLASIAFFYDSKPCAGIIALALVIPCVARYYERRLKSTTQAYLHVMTLYRLGGLHTPPQKDEATGD